MKNGQHYYNRLRLCCIEAAAITLTVCAFLFPSAQPFQHTGDNFFAIKLNGVAVGNLASADNLDRLLTEARRQAALQDESKELVFMDAELEMEGSEKIWAAVDNEDTVVENMTKVMKDSIRKTLHRSYTVKVNDTSVNLGSYGEVHELLE